MIEHEEFQSTRASEDARDTTRASLRALFLFQSTRASEDARDVLHQRDQRGSNVSIHARVRGRARPLVAFALDAVRAFQSTRASEDARDRPRSLAPRRPPGGFNPRARPRTRATPSYAVVTTVIRVSIHARVRGRARRARLRAARAHAEQFQSTRASEDARDLRSDRPCPSGSQRFNPRARPRTRATGRSRARVVSRSSFNPRARPRTRATMASFPMGLALAVSIHARVRGRARRVVLSASVSRLPEFQSTRASEDARDDAPPAAFEAMSMFQSTRASEDARDRLP